MEISVPENTKKKSFLLLAAYRVDATPHPRQLTCTPDMSINSWNLSYTSTESLRPHPTRNHCTGIKDPFAAPCVLGAVDFALHQRFIKTRPLEVRGNHPPAFPHATDAIGAHWWSVANLPNLTADRKSRDLVALHGTPFFISRLHSLLYFYPLCLKIKITLWTSPETQQCLSFSVVCQEKLEQTKNRY